MEDTNQPQAAFGAPPAPQETAAEAPPAAPAFGAPPSASATPESPAATPVGPAPDIGNPGESPIRLKPWDGVVVTDTATKEALQLQAEADERAAAAPVREVAPPSAAVFGAPAAATAFTIAPPSAAAFGAAVSAAPTPALNMKMVKGRLDNIEQHALFWGGEVGNRIRHELQLLRDHFGF